MVGGGGGGGGKGVWWVHPPPLMKLKKRGTGLGVRSSEAKVQSKIIFLLFSENTFQFLLHHYVLSVSVKMTKLLKALETTSVLFWYYVMLISPFLNCGGRTHR